MKHNTFTVIVLIAAAMYSQAQHVPSLQELISHQQRIQSLEDQLPFLSTDASISLPGPNRQAKLQTTRMPNRLLMRRDKVRLVVNNGDYFAVEMNDTNQSYSLLAYLKTGGRNHFDGTLGFQYASVHPLTTLAGGYNVVEYLSDPAFLLTRSSVDPDGLLRVEYKSRHRLKQQGEDVKCDGNPVTGTLWFDPRTGYCIVKELIQLTVQKTGEIDIYKCARVMNSTGSDPEVKAYEMQVSLSHADRPFQTQKYSYSYSNTSPVAEAEYSLEFYGLSIPDHDVYEDRGFNWYLWGGIGLGCVALSVTLAWLVRRKRRKS